MFTTIPYLFKTYERKIFTHNYESSRLFTTVFFQDSYLKLVDNLFCINKSANKQIDAKALAEIHTMIKNAKS